MVDTKLFRERRIDPYGELRNLIDTRSRFKDDPDLSCAVLFPWNFNRRPLTSRRK